MYLVTAHEMREMDRRTIESFGLPGRILMENAGGGATCVLNNYFNGPEGKKIAVLAGRGNNGGDGFVMARYLAQRGADVTVYLLSDRSAVKGDAGANLNLLDPLHIPVIEIPDQKHFGKHKKSMLDQHILIDAMLGTGLSSDVNGYFYNIIEFVNNSEKPVFSVDIPSGLDSDTGRPRGICIKAHTTATFAFPKIGHVLLPGASYVGNLKIVNIGIPPYIADAVAPAQFLLTPDTVKSYIRPRPADAHKGTTGHLLVLSGSPGKTGAAAMTSKAALRTGAGLVTVGIPAGINPLLETQVAEAMTLPLPEDKNGGLSESSFQSLKTLLNTIKCIAVGPGLGVSDGTKQLIEDIIFKSEKPLVIDADGLNCIQGNTGIFKNHQFPMIITPHPGEMSRLTGDSVASIQNDRIACARKFAKVHNVHVVLKGAKTVIAHPNGKAFINPTGNSGMASGGMGDVLTGIIAGFVTQGYSPEKAARLGVYIHGAAADTLAASSGRIGFLATDIIDELPCEIDKLFL